MMTLNYGVGTEDAVPNKGHSDFVQHTGPIISGLLRVSLSDAQTLPVTFGYSQDQAANMQSANNSLKMFQRTNLSSVQFLCANGAAAQKEKGRTANPTFWDACFFNHQENQLLAELQDNLPSLRGLVHRLKPSFSQSQNHTGISGEVKPWRRGVLQKFRKTSTCGTYEAFVGDRVTGSKPVQPSGSSLAFLRCSAFSLRPQASSTQAEKLAPGYSAFSCSTLASISSISSCGNLIFFCADLALMDFVAIAYPFVDGAGTPYIKGMDKKRLTCGPTDNMVGVHLDCIKMENSNAPECGNTAEASNHNVNEAYTMACQHSTQTRPKFVYLFLASYPLGGKPIMLRTEANSELEARLRVAGDYSLTFAAQIRTESPCVIHRYCEESDLTSTYICNKADAYPVCNAGKNSFCENPCQPRPEAHHV